MPKKSDITLKTEDMMQDTRDKIAEYFNDLGLNYQDFYKMSITCKAHVTKNLTKYTVFFSPHCKHCQSEGELSTLFHTFLSYDVLELKKLLTKVVKNIFSHLRFYCPLTQRTFGLTSIAGEVLNAYYGGILDFPEPIKIKIKNAMDYVATEEEIEEYRRRDDDNEENEAELKHDRAKAVKGILNSIQSIVEEVKEDMGDGRYVKVNKYLKDLFECI